MAQILPFPGSRRTPPRFLPPPGDLLLHAALGLLAAPALLALLAVGVPLAAAALLLGWGRA